MAGRLTGKRILVAGAGGKVGAQFACAFAAEGADLVLTTRTESKLTPLAKDELSSAGTRVASVAADFMRDAEIDQLAAKAWDAFGGLDVILLSSQPAQPRMGDVLSISKDTLIYRRALLHHYASGGGRNEATDAGGI